MTPFTMFDHDEGPLLEPPLKPGGDDEPGSATSDDTGDRRDAISANGDGLRR